jgi:hypothetical protein
MPGSVRAVPKEQTRAREAAWSRRAGLAAVVGALLALAGFLLLRVAIGGGVNFEGLKEAHDNAALAWLSGIFSLVGYVALVVPLYFLFKAAEARDRKVRNQFVGLVLLGPLLLGISGVLLAAGTQQAANSYLDHDPSIALSAKDTAEVKKECSEELQDKGQKAFAEEFDEGGTPEAACEMKKGKEEEASQAIQNSTFVTAGSFAGLAGGLAFVVALFYTGLWSMRTGLLSRFWGSLGMAVGIAALIGLTPLALVWFIYLGLLFLGVLPGGKPPAWDAGESVPWPTPGERAAEELSGGDDDSDDRTELQDPALPAPDPRTDGAPPEPAPEKRKRKQRD